jgi:hypothetical protein
MEKASSGIKFSRLQVPIRLIYVGTVHRSQGTTLDRAVVDLRKDLWERGQLYVALSRIRDPHNLCIMLPPAPEREPEDEQVEPQSAEEEEQQEDIPIRVTVDEEMMTIISDMYRNKTSESNDQTKNTEEIQTIQEPVQIVEIQLPRMKKAKL